MGLHQPHLPSLNENYISNLCVKFDHPFPFKPQHSPYGHAPIVYGAKIQYATGPDDTPLDASGILRVQSIVGALLNYARAVDNKLLVAMSALGQQQATATKATNDVINQILDYVATYPSDGITFCASNMVLSAHSDTALSNVSKARSHAGTHIMLSKDVPVPKYNGPVITIAQIIKCVMSSAAEFELVGLYICTKEMVPLRQLLIEMGWPQPRSPLRCDNSTAIGVANETIIPRKTKSTDILFHWLQCEMLNVNSDISGHLAPTILATTAPIPQSTTSPNGRSDKLPFTALGSLHFILIFLLFAHNGHCNGV